MNTLYLASVAFGVTLLVASLVLGGKDTDHGGHDTHADHGAGFGWAPITSLRFWIFVFTFGGAVGLALTELGQSSYVAAGAALGVGWLSGAIAIAMITAIRRNSVSSEVGARDLVGATGTLLLPVGPHRPGKVRVEVKGRQEDFVANVVDEGELPAGSSVLIVAEGERGTLLVSKGEM